jgi:hypothetical protein
VFFFWWQVWKERNKRIFDLAEYSFLQVSDKIAQSISDFHRVHAIQTAAL